MSFEFGVWVSRANGQQPKVNPDLRFLNTTQLFNIFVWRIYSVGQVKQFFPDFLQNVVCLSQFSELTYKFAAGLYNFSTGLYNFSARINKTASVIYNSSTRITETAIASYITVVRIMHFGVGLYTNVVVVYKTATALTTIAV